MAEITRKDLLDLPVLPSQAPSITDVKHLASYNWIEAPTPTIAVPGAPALWAPPKQDRPLRKDSGLMYIAQNAARHPNSPLEPLFQALLISNPSLDYRSVDVITDRNNVRKLLSFVNPGSSRNGLEPFTIGLEVVNGTVMFCRQETKTHELIGPDEFRGFGHEFEKTYTKNQIHDSTGHHRILSYSFGGLNFLVRHETDGCVATAKTKPSNSTIRDADSGDNGDSLAGALGSLSLSPTASEALASPIAGSKMEVRRDGEVVPLESTLEIKTRVFHKPLEIKDIAPQLWVSQTPKLVRAYHRQGLFKRPKVEDMTRKIKVWEEDNKRDLETLAALMNRILTLAKELGGSIIMKYESDGDKLVLSKVTGTKMLPDQLYPLIWSDDAQVDSSAK